MKKTREITRNNKFRVFPKEYEELSKKIQVYKKLKHDINSSIFSDNGDVKKSIDDMVTKDIQDSITTLNSQISIEIERLRQQQKLVEGEIEVYRVSGMTFKKVYDEIIDISNPCNSCDIKCPCWSFNHQIGCVKRTLSEFNTLTDEELCNADSRGIVYEGVFKRLNETELQIYS